jgi:hypothetical protein
VGQERKEVLIRIAILEESFGESRNGCGEEGQN